MTPNRLFPLFVAAALAGCEMPQDSAAPAPPEEIAEATPPEGGARPSDDPKAPDKYEVSLDTTEGEVVVEVDRSLAPHGADRFYRLVKEGYYDGAKFFRVVSGFVAQFGMAADPKVNKKWDRATIPDDPVHGSNTPGTVTFATSGPDSRTAQIFINYGDNSSLDGQGFSPFGRVTKGMEAVEKFYSGYGERPDQGRIAIGGNEYLDRVFPELDAIKTARVISEDGKPIGEANAAAPEVPAEGEGQKPATAESETSEPAAP